jgi:hypothetical protein
MQRAAISEPLWREPRVNRLWNCILFDLNSGLVHWVLLLSVLILILQNRKPKLSKVK